MDAVPLRVLLIEDNPGDARLIEEMFAEALSGMFELEWVDTLALGQARLSQEGIDALLLDLNLPDSQGLQTLLSVRAHSPNLPIVILSGQADERVVFATVREGAQDYLVKERLEAYALLRSLSFAVERKQHEAAQHFLAQASQVLATSLDDTTTLYQVARLAVPFIGDCCIIDVVDENKRIRQTALAHRDPGSEDALRAFRRCFPSDASSHLLLLRALDTGEAIVYRDLGSYDLAATSYTSEQLEAARALGFRSGMIAPLIARGHTLGAICVFIADSGRCFDQADLTLATDLARRVALSIDNAQLYRQAQEAIRLRDIVLSSVSHDLRNPLTAIRLICDTAALLLGAVQDPNARQIKEALGRIDANTQRMAAQIEELLDVARLQVGSKIPLAYRRSDLVALAGEIIGEYQQRTVRHRIQLEAAVPEVIGTWDGTRLGRVLGNLLSNAVKYSPNGGDIVVRIWLEEDDQATWANLAVQDCGLGIPATDLPRVFSWFFRGDNVANQIAGAGIGLAGSRRIVEQHGGTLHVQSQEGVGSIFTARLPLASPA